MPQDQHRHLIGVVAQIQVIPFSPRVDDAQLPGIAVERFGILVVVVGDHHVHGLQEGEPIRQETRKPHVHEKGAHLEWHPLSFARGDGHVVSLRPWRHAHSLHVLEKLLRLLVPAGLGASLEGPIPALPTPPEALRAHLLDGLHGLAPICVFGILLQRLLVGEPIHLRRVGVLRRQFLQLLLRHHRAQVVILRPLGPTQGTDVGVHRDGTHHRERAKSEQSRQSGRGRRDCTQ
mmetsp:Transcript_23625/g.60089  ORF Transcript_23625/g.60089 Transcript_23625/m.60089 type:complete len:233 (+) Transcript_23625:627-1325(+)